VATLRAWGTRTTVQDGNRAPRAVSENLRQLEEPLGVRLCHRTTRKRPLTEAGPAPEDGGAIRIGTGGSWCERS